MQSIPTVTIALRADHAETVAELARLGTAVAAKPNELLADNPLVCRSSADLLRGAHMRDEFALAAFRDELDAALLRIDTETRPSSRDDEGYPDLLPGELEAIEAEDRRREDVFVDHTERVEAAMIDDLDR